MTDSLIDYLTGYFDVKWTPYERQALAITVFTILASLAARRLHKRYKRRQNDPYKDTEFGENGAVKKN